MIFDGRVICPVSPMGREQKRRVDARKAKQLVQSGQAQRRSGVVKSLDVTDVIWNIVVSHGM